ncbi:MAG: hypothetical protein PSX80_02865 [bacterium]|nr:hypothetical protein [bacterium]
MREIHKIIFLTTACLLFSVPALADVRVKQKVTTSGQTMESTRSIKGSRERAETKIEMGDPEAAAFMPQIATITQCDLRRSVRVNDRARLYMVEPFATVGDTAPVTRTMPDPTRRTTTTRQGGTITITYTVRDTGERKMMFGLQARHLITTNEMESSADSCNGPSKTKMEYDGWYVDFSAEFNCPQATPDVPRSPRADRPDCSDRFVTKGSAAARLGFLLEGRMKMFGPDGSVQMTQTTETLELSRSPLNIGLFDIPVGYREVTSTQDLYAIQMPSVGIPSVSSRRSATVPLNPAANPASKSVALNVNLSGVQPTTRAEAEQYIRGKIAERGLRAVTGTGDYALNFDFRQVKESTAGKVGGIFGKVTGVDTKVGKVDIDMTATLSGGATGQAKVKSKFDGPLSDALRTAIDQALDQVLRNIEN